MLWEIQAILDKMERTELWETQELRENEGHQDIRDTVAFVETGDRKGSKEGALKGRKGDS